jgi:hypothetical protein
MEEEDNVSPSPSPAPRRSYNVYTVVGLAIAAIATAIYYLLFVSAPPPEAPATIAHLRQVAGDVSVKSGSGAWHAGEAGLGLRMEDQVRTAPASGAEIAFANGNIVRVGPESIVLIGDLASLELEQRGAAWRLQSGRARFDTRESTEIRMANATTRAEANSTGAIDLTGGGDTGIRIFKGSARVTTSKGETVTLAANEGVRVDNAGQAGPKMTLPAAPTLLAPGEQAELPHVAAPEVTTRLAWNPVALGSTYRIAIDFNVEHADLLLSAALDERGVSSSSWDLRGLDLGKYFWRVAAVNEAGMEGDFSRVSRFSVIEPPAPEAGEPELLVVDAVEAVSNVVHVKGRTHPSASVTVNGNAVKVRGDGSFDEYLKGGTPLFVIRVTGPDGRVAEESRRVEPVGR